MSTASAKPAGWYTRAHVVVAVLSAILLAVYSFSRFEGRFLVASLPVYYLVWLAWHSTRQRFGPWVWLALALGVLGGLLLDVAPPRTVQARPWFLGGVAAYLLGHLCYIKAFWGRPLYSWQRLAIAGAVVVFAAAFGSWVASALAANPDTRPLMYPVWGYVAVLAFTAVLCVCRSSATWHIAAGALVFMLSDSLIGYNFFIRTEASVPILLAIKGTYALAQHWLWYGAARENDQYISA